MTGITQDLTTAGPGERAAEPRGVLARSWNAVTAAVIVASLIGDFILTARDRGSTAANFGDLFSYFTIQSNLLVLACALTLIVDPGRDGRLWRILRLDAVLGIIITGLVYVTILRGTGPQYGSGVLVNAGLHYFTPAFVLLGWLLVGPRPRIDWSTIGWIFVWPFAWIAYTFAHGAITGWYPYAFLDVVTHGYAESLFHTALIVVLALVIAVIMRSLDRRLPTIRS